MTCAKTTNVYWPLLLAAAVMIAGCGNTVDRVDSARLPKALKASKSVDEAAAELARTVHAGDDRERLRALLAAAERSGFAVSDPELDNKAVREPMQPAQGLAFVAGEIVAMDRLLEREYAVQLDDLAELLKQIAPPELELRDAPLRDFLLNGIRATAQHDPAERPTQRFWARFIVELGRNGPRKYDMLSTEPGESISLDGAQMMFILLRYIGDLHAATNPVSDGALSYAAIPKAVTHASLLALPSMRPFAMLEGERRSCTMTDTEATIMDAGSLAYTYGFGELLDYVGGAAKRAGKALNVVNNVLAFAKLLTVGALTEAKLEFVDGTPELERTKSNTSHGERKELRATIRLNSGGWHYFNCARVALNSVGADFDVGNDGPIEGATVSWAVDRPGGMDAAIESARNAPFQFVGSDIVHGKTNKDGQITATIEGRKQRYQIPKNAEPVRKKVAVTIKYSLKESTFWQDVVDAISVGLGGVASGIPELLMRTLPFYTRQTFTIVDWAADYKFDYTEGGVRFSGFKCEGPAGEWTIDITDELDDKMAVRGSIFANVNEQSLRGRYGGNMEIQPEGWGAQIMKFSMQIGGPVTFNASEPRLLLQSGTVSGSVSGKVNFPLGGPGGALSLPLQVGAFCE